MFQGFTSIDKALVSTVYPIVYWANIAFFGGELDVQEISDLIIPVVVSVVPLLVYVFPNAGFTKET